MSVKVGVRVRPFNQRQSDLNCKLCVDMVGNMTRLFDPEDPQQGKHRDFTFDYSFWSHDQFEVDQKGYFVPASPKYADQRHVFEQVGIQILSNAWQGYHCCLFAYGQTGAGKSYSMVGYGANKGIVPISCQQIFNRIANNDDKNKQYEVMVSMMEIYNEKVQDLLIPINKRPPQGHKIRQHKTLGIYIEGMSKHFVDTYQSIQKKMDEGSRNRSVAATAMNASSSRAHTIISIQFKQTVVDNGKKRQKLSVIHLVDLAGSQKVGKTGATGDRLKQAAGINKSLSALGLVISKLADKAMGKQKNVIVPYRDSCLTRILQNALGGNSKTLMICAISPATDNYDQTLSTLRYADQAKKIQNKAVVNESQTDKLIRTLTQQRQELRLKVLKMQEMLSKYQMGNISQQMLDQLKQVKQQERYVNQSIADREATKQDKKKHQQQEQHFYAAKIDLSKPHLSNLNQDPQLSRKINYSLSDQINNIGRRGSQPPNHIQIGGMGIRKMHAKIIQQRNQQEGQYLMIVPQQFVGDDSNCYLNGDQIIKGQKLYHLDRLSFGTNNMFLVLIPSTNPREQVDEKKINWDYAQNELYLKKSQIQRLKNEELQQKLRQQTQKVLLQKQRLLKELEASLKNSEQQRKKTAQLMQKQKFEVQRKLLQVKVQQAKKLKQQIAKNKQKLREGDFKFKQQNKQKINFQRKLLKTLPKCIELNLIAKQFKKNINLSVKMMLADGDDDEDIQLKKRSIMIRVVNKDAGYCYWWQPQTLSNRYYIIKDMSEQYFETGIIPPMTQKQDPFWDPPSPALIGRCFLTTKALTYMFDNPATLPIIGQDQQCGQLIVNLIPTDETGVKNLCEQMDQQQIQFQPEQLLDKPFHVLIVIQKGLVPLNYKGVYVQYSFKTNELEKQEYKTQIIQEKNTNPVFNYQKVHSFPKITEGLLQYLSQSKLIFRVYGIQLVQQERKKQIVKNSKEVTNVEKTVQQTKPITTKPLQISDTKKAQKNADTTKKVKKVDNPGASKQPKKDEGTLKHGGSKVNNKINERDLKKDKDCQIY